MKKINILNTMVGKIYVKESLGGTPVRYLCTCPCGSEFTATSQTLRKQKTDCGCGSVTNKRKKIFTSGDSYKGCVIQEVFKRYGHLTSYNYLCKCGKPTSKVHSDFLDIPYCKDCQLKDIYKKKAIQYEGSVINGIKIIKYLGVQDEQSYVSAICPKCNKSFDTALSRIKNGIRYCGECNKINLDKGHEYINMASVDGTNIISIQPDRKLNKNNSTGYRGISMLNGKYRVYINFCRKQYSLGVYSKIDDAIAARKSAEKEIYGNFIKWYQETYPEYWEKINKRNEK